MNKKWEYYSPNEEKVKYISNKFNISTILSKILVNREITKNEDIQIFLNPTRNDFHNPFFMPDMEKAVDRILKAIKNKEKVIIYGDYDVDGITSITVLKKFLEEQGLSVGYYIPNRLEEGYGLNIEAIQDIVKEGYSLMITVDCGISSIKEIELCNSLGLETIITDHHEQLENLPNAFAIIDAKRKDNMYPFRELAGVGVVFKLIQALSIKLKLDEKEFLKYLDIVCIGTISDIVPLIDENRVIAKLGLKLVQVTKNVGLKELINGLGYKKIDSNTISFGIAPRINACGRMGYQNEAIKLFLTNNIEEAKEITQELNKYNSQRQETEKNIFEQTIKTLQQKEVKDLKCIILGEENWHHGVIGIVASRLTEKFSKPTILICFEGDEAKGSGRSVSGFDLHNALVKTNKYLLKYGGHEMAVGLSMKRDMFYKFKEEFEKIASEQKLEEIVPIIKIEQTLSVREINEKIIEELKTLEPFGEKNKEPIFSFRNLKIDSIRALSEGKHLKLTLKDENYIINGIGFNLGDLSGEYLIGDKIDVAGMLKINEYNGIKSIQINIRDIMKSIT